MHTMAKRSLPSDASTSTAEHCKSVVDPKWKEDVPWLEVSEGDCGLFSVNDVKSTAADPKKSGDWKSYDLPYTTITQQSHGKSVT